MRIVKNEILSNGFLKLKKYTIVHENIEFDREFIDVGETVCALVHNTKSNKFIFVKQFRPGNKSSSLIEIPGGLVENEKPVHTIFNEIVEEVGYKSDEIKFLFSTYLVPAYSSERILFYYIKVSEKINKGGGLKKDNEYIEVVELSKEEIKKIDFYKNSDSKTILMLNVTNLIQPLMLL